MDTVLALRTLVLSMKNDWGAFPLIDFFHGTAVAYEYRKGASPKHAPLQRLVAIVLTALGGTMMTGVLLGQPPSWVLYSEVVPAYFLCWALMHCVPLDPLFRLLEAPAPLGPVLRFTLGALDDVSWGVAITSWGQDKALQAQHGPARASITAALLTGFMSGCGGGLLQQAFGFNDAEWSFRTPPALVRASFAIKLSAGCSLAYYYAVDPHGYIAAAAVAVALPGPWHSLLPPFTPPAEQEEWTETVRVGIICAVVLLSTVRTTLLSLFLGAPPAVQARMKRD
jgi:uncharacterized membrane protein YeiH